MKFYIYILQSQQDNSYYVGYTSDLEGRLWEHNEGRTNYTTRKRPWKLVYSETFETKTEAIRRENQIKARKSRKYIEQLISSANH